MNTPVSPEVDAALERRVDAQLITLLFRQQLSSAVANVLVASIFLWLTWDEITLWQLLAWYGGHLCIVALRLYSRHRFLTRTPVPGDEVRWRRLSAALSALVGSSWGLCALLFVSPEDPHAYIALTIIITGFAAGSVTAFAPYFPGYLAHVIPSMGGLALALALTEETLLLGIAALVVAGFVAYTPASRNVHRTLRRSVSLGMENLALRERAEQRSELLHTVLETMSQGILVTDGDTQPQIWNQRLTEILGVTADNSEQGLLNQQLQTVGLPTAEQSPRPVERRLDDGTVLEIASARMPSGGSVTTFSDISTLIERERAEESARIAAEQANAAKTRFLAAASHDLRQPIHALGLFLDALSESKSPQHSKQLTGYVRDALNAIDSMLNSLLDVSKLDAGVVHPEPETFDVSGLIEEVYRGACSQAGAAGLELRIRSPANALPVTTDRGMLGRILRNLVGNAIRYTEHGGVLLAVRQRVAGVRIDVIDTGIGIAPDQLQEIFVEFHQLGNRQRDREQGLGLGLAIVSRLVTLLGLTLDTRSRPGRGSCFSLMLPTPSSQIPSAHSDANPLPEPGNIHGLRILVLDDDTNVLLAMQVLLRQWGCDVRVAGQFADATAAVSDDWVPQLMIIDYRLPDVQDGIEAIAQLRLRAGSVPAMLVTGDTGPEHLRRAERSGLPVMHKPVRFDQLRRIVTELADDSSH